jgi:hypothetical protein
MGRRRPGLFLWAILGFFVLLGFIHLNGSLSHLGGSSTPPATTTSTTGGSPGGGSAWIERLWVEEGGSASTEGDAACIAEHESSDIPTETSSNPDGGTNVGLFQLDTPGGVGAGYSISQLENPELNTRIAIEGSKDGTDWADWATALDCGL